MEALVQNKKFITIAELKQMGYSYYKIGKLVGKTTFGKGIVQRVFDLKDGTAVNLTVSDYYTPNGNNIHGIGIEPDVEVDYDADAYAKDKTDNQLEKAIEVMNGLLDK